MQLILGSQSPRRAEILRYFDLPFKVEPPDFVEEAVVFQGNPITYAEELALGKVRSLATHYPHLPILTADTVVFKEGRIFNKPTHPQEGLEMLATLNGSSHSVFTALALQWKETCFLETEETRVYFHSVSQEQLRLYHAAFKCNDKAGGYCIQKGGSVIIKKIEGCFYNVMGLPLNTLQKLLLKMGIDLWHYLPSSY